MIAFFYETEIEPFEESALKSWIATTIVSEDKKEGEIVFIICDDEYLLKINQDFLNHDTYTDIITFDNTVGNQLHAEIYISDERVSENAIDFGTSKEEEMRRVMIHGVLHLCGYKDKTEEEGALMRSKENEKLKLFHVEQ